MAMRGIDTRRKESLVHPSVASLNSLAEVLRQAKPLYIECRSILNCLADGDDVVSFAATGDFGSHPDDPQPSPLFEQQRRCHWAQDKWKQQHEMA